jgi:hypothetical protein
MRRLILQARIVSRENLSWHGSKRNPSFGGSIAPPANYQSFINKDPDQPAAKRAFVFEAWWISRRSHPAVFNGILGSFRTAENPAGDEMQ